MIATTRRTLWAGALLALLSLPALPAAGQAGDPGLRVALTFDDVPVTGASSCDPAHVREVTGKLTAALAARSLPAAGLATPGRACLTPPLLEETLGRWREIGAVIGNHSATHPDLNTTPIDVYLADIDRGQALIEAAVGPVGRWFRPPYLHSGDEPGKKAALHAHLDERGYAWAPVSVDNQEWVYAAVYEDARRRGDTALLERVVDGYIDHLDASMAFYEALSTAVFGRQISQTLLLHANMLNAEHLDRVVAMLETRGYAFIGMPEALSDPAYDREDTYVGPRGLSWLQRWALADGVSVPDEPREAEWVAEEYRRMQRRARGGAP